MKQKGLRKLVSIVLMVVMVLSMSATAFAADLTINNTNTGETYSVYKIFDATTNSDETGTTYYISTSSAYYNDVENSSIFSLVATGETGVYQVTWASSTTDAALTAELVSYGAKGNAVATETGNGGTVQITDLAAGYYFVTTTTGTAVSIGNTGEEVKIADKNSKPTVEKGETTDGTAGIGDKVEYKATISDAENVTVLVYHDEMSEGLTFNNDVVVKIGDDTLTAGTDYKVLTDDDMKDKTCTFEIEFTTAGLNKVDKSEKVVITYSATVNSDAVKKDAMTNKATLSYGNDSKSETSTTETYTYDISIFKYTGTDAALADAKFILYKVVGETTYYATVGKGVLSSWNEDETSATTLTSNDQGKIAVDGLDAGTYYLKETEAPAGYNQLTAAITVTISDDDKDGVATVGYTYEGNTGTGEIKVLNNAGAALPSTGGVGTKIFYIVGGILVLGAAVLFVTKKRLGNENL